MASRILLIEDEPLHERLYELAITKLPQVKVFSAGEERQAMDIITRERPDVILLDLVIPTTVERDRPIDFHEPIGFEILRQVKTNPQTKQCRVIIFTNLDADEHQRRAEELGADDYLVKANTTPQQLTDYLKSRLARSES